MPIFSRRTFDGTDASNVNITSYSFPKPSSRKLTIPLANWVKHAHRWLTVFTVSLGINDPGRALSHNKPEACEECSTFESRLAYECYTVRLPRDM